MRPRIAITVWRRELPTFLGERTLLYTLADEYVAAIHAAGGVPVLLPHLEPAAAEDVLDLADGLVVSGGGDVDPASYGAPLDGSYGTDAAADASELGLIGLARQRDVPTLAICRGMHLVNVAAGGTLRQDITDHADEHPAMGDHPAEILAARHEIDVLPGSRLAEVVGAGPRRVNTIHHQAIDRLGEGLRVTAAARDGIVEAVEDERWDMLAVQWHPEKLGTEEAPLFQWLVERAATTGARA